MSDIVTDPSDPENAFAALLNEPFDRPLRTAVIHPVDEASLIGALEAARIGLIAPILIGPEARIRGTAKTAKLSLSDAQIIDTPHSHAAAAKGVVLARSQDCDAIMKGALHTNELMEACVQRDYGIRTDRRMSHIYVMDTPELSRWLFITDGALNIAPDLEDKKWIIQNAIDLARALGVDVPKVAILSATEEVDPLIPSTIEAAALCKMAERGQISDGILDGPLAFDLAMSRDAVRTKGLVSEVAGQADILVVPTLEAGNMLAKELDYLAGAAASGIVLGGKVPIILTSRADSAAERIASCALAQHYLAWKDR